MDDLANDPEFQAELEYASKNGIDVHSLNNVKARLTKSKSQEDDVLKKELVGVNAPRINGVIQVPRVQKNQRKSRTGYGRGLPKKGGAGGRGTWGKNGMIYDESEENDPDDPNYDSEGNVKFEPIAAELSESDVAKVIEIVLLEYLENGDVEDAVDSINDMDFNQRARPVVVQYIVTTALDHKPSQRELCSMLLCELVYKRVLTVTDMERGFHKLLNKDLKDLSVDYPTAPEAFGKFIARAIADEALPEDFVALEKKNETCCEASEALEQAELRLRDKQVLHSVWVGGGNKPVRYLVRKIKVMLQEYLNSGDKEEALRCLKDLEVPHFHHEVVYQAGVFVIEAMHERPMRLLAELLQFLYNSGIITQNNVEDGFVRLYEAIPDLCLDVPPAYTLLERWVAICQPLGFLPPHVARSMPSKGRKRFVSEGDGGRLKVTDVPVPHPFI